MSKLRVLAILGVCTALVACKDNKPAATDEVEKSTTAQKPSDSPKKVPRKAIEEAAVRALVNDWQVAQNAGDFAAYERLFAAKMQGVKRIGQRTKRYNRSTWLKDRERMFKKKMTVTVDKMTVSTSPSAAGVAFVQTWASGKYKDTGPKRLVVVREGKALKIAREEMVASQVLSSSKTPMDLATAGFAVVHNLSGPKILLSTTAKASWASGNTTLLSKANPIIAARTATQVPSRELKNDAKRADAWV